LSTFGVFESTKKIEGVTFKMKIVYLAKAFPEREYSILSSLKEIEKNVWIGLIEFSKIFYIQAKQLNQRKNVCDKILIKVSKVPLLSPLTRLDNIS
jgi:hypothetical protein